ncbi:AarF/UbiB family protein [Myroides ceti]|uniref:AarF/UbiB family protein n=1 Tax=Paenimyroides ceti TaxID=395087 RepID=A0ABT8CWL1_9FLAO|nr:AarF/UbiB family protein [Paenimyroides ceti]MDN3707424.1 AarF/UbiB family protein [Paenimyroides ceti]
MNHIRKIKRLGNIFSILWKYGFDDVISRIASEKYLPDGFVKSKRGEQIFQLSIYERIRLVLEELGPTYIKFGQTFSNREDLIPKELLTELEKLQDKVPAEKMDLIQKIEEELSIQVSDHFEYIDLQPIASASISQVYKGKLLNGQEVVIKVKRSGIDTVIHSDLLIMKDLAQLLENYYEAAKKMNLLQIISSFENAILKELSFKNEFQNIEQFRRNFSQSQQVTVPKTYKEYSNDRLLCMEFIDGFKINDKQKILSLGWNPDEIAQIGLNAYLKQILEDGFFHADPHPGNILLLENKQIVFIDFGSVGQMMVSEKEELENLIINFLLKDARRIIKNVKKLAISYNIKDEKALERDIHEIFTHLNSSSLKEINAGAILNRLKSILANNNVLMPEYIYLLMRGITLIEGIGKQLNPELNISDSIQPYIIKTAGKRFSPDKVAQKAFKNIRLIADTLQELPEETNRLFEKIKDDKLLINHEVKGLEDIRKTLQNVANRLTYAIIIAALSIGSSILLMAHIPPLLFGNSVLGLLGFLVSGFLGLIIIYSIWKKDK